MEDTSTRIEAAKRELEQMVDLNPQAMLLVDEQHRVLRASQRALELFGYENFPDVLGRSVLNLLNFVDPSGAKELLESDGGYVARDLKVRASAGEDRLLRFTRISSGYDGSVAVVVVRDVTSERERAALSEKSHKMEAVQALAGALMHRINQPLTVIIMRAKLMRLAVEKGNAREEELQESLSDIIELAMEIGEVIRRVENPRDFVTEPYLDGVDILDIESSGRDSESPLTDEDAAENL